MSKPAPERCKTILAMCLQLMSQLPGTRCCPNGAYIRDFTAHAFLLCFSLTQGYVFLEVVFPHQLTNLRPELGSSVIVLAKSTSLSITVPSGMVLRHNTEKTYPDMADFQAVPLIVQYVIQ